MIYCIKKQKLKGEKSEGKAVETGRTLKIGISLKLLFPYCVLTAKKKKV